MQEYFLSILLNISIVIIEGFGVELACLQL
jgi:hypothetical protein